MSDKRERKLICAKWGKSSALAMACQERPSW